MRVHHRVEENQVASQFEDKSGDYPSDRIELVPLCEFEVRSDVAYGSDWQVWISNQESLERLSALAVSLDEDWLVFFDAFEHVSKQLVVFVDVVAC